MLPDDRRPTTDERDWSAIRPSSLVLRHPATTPYWKTIGSWSGPQHKIERFADPLEFLTQLEQIGVNLVKALADLAAVAPEDHRCGLPGRVGQALFQFRCCGDQPGNPYSGLIIAYLQVQ